MRLLLGVLLLAAALPLARPGPAYADPNPAPVQVFYLTLPEADALTVLSAINSAAVSPVTTCFSIAIGVSGMRVYYDQWENGYDSDIANPTNLYSSSNPGGTQIWGNGLVADGCPPNKNGAPVECTPGNDVLNAGDVIIPSNTVPIPRNSSVILFDARDKIGASSSIAMARATWAAGSGTLNAFAHEMYATAEWGTAYESPVGTNTATPAQGYSGEKMFEYSALSVMASQNSTTVQIDKDANGIYESSVTLQEGGVTLVTGTSQGARVQTTDAAKPIQVMLVTGDIGSNYESRDMTLLPVSTYGRSYWSPVGVNTGLYCTPGPTRLFLYNPSANSNIYITCKRRSPTPTTVTQGPVAARGMVYVDLNDNSGANCFAVTVAGGNGYLNAWMDFTGDGGAAPLSPDGNFIKAAGGYDSYSTCSEHVVQDVLVSAGTQTVNVTLPPGALGAAGAYFRFRLSPRDGSSTCTTAVGPTGFVSGGEVEDYYIVHADLSVTKTDGKTTVAPGATVEYTLVVKNNGSSTATGVTLADTIGINLTFQSSTCGTYSQNGSTYTWPLADLAPGQSTSCKVTVVVSSPLSDGVQLTNYAHVSTTALEVNVTDNEVSDIDTTLNTPLPDLWVTESDGNTQVLAGNTLVYTIQYGNAGTVGATGVSIVDTLPANVTYQSSNPAGTVNGSTVTWWIGSVAASGSGSVQVTIIVNSDQLAGAVVLNHVGIDGAENDKNPADDSAIDSDTVVAPYVVTEKSASGPDPVTGEVTYAITWINNSTATAANVQIRDTLSANTTLVAGSITGGGTLSGGVITWNLGSQAAGASGTVSFCVTLGAGAGGAAQTASTLSIETGTGSVTVASQTSEYSSLPWCDKAFSSGRCLRYRGLFSGRGSACRSTPAPWLPA